MSTSTVRAHLLAAASPCDAQSCRAHTATAMSSQLQPSAFIYTVCELWMDNIYG